MSARSHQPIGRTRRSRRLVMPGHAMADGSTSVSCSLSRISSATRTTCTISATACTRTMCAPPSTAAVTAAAVPQSRSAAGRPPSGLAHERLARRPDEHRPVERRGNLGQPRQHTIAVRRPFGKPEPGIDDEPLARARRRPSRCACCLASSPSPRRPRPSYSASRVHRRSSVRACASGRAPRRASATTPRQRRVVAAGR